MKVVLLLLLVSAMLVACNNQVKPATTEEIVADFQSDTENITKQFGSTVLNQDARLIALDEDLSKQIDEYKAKYQGNPNLTEKEESVSSVLLGAIDMYEKWVERKDDTFNQSEFLQAYNLVLQTLNTLQDMGFEIR